MFGEADLVRVFRVGIVRVDGLCPVRVLGRLRHLTLGAIVIGRRAWTRASAGGSKAGLGRVALGTWRSTGVSRHGGRGLEAAQLCGGVHLRGVVGGHRFGTGTECARHGSAAAVGPRLLLVQRERVDEAAVRGLGRRAEVEDPNNLNGH